jgi:hypothetical protein
MSNTTLILFVLSENSPDILDVFGFLQVPDHPVLAPYK